MVSGARFCVDLGIQAEHKPSRLEVETELFGAVTSVSGIGARVKNLIVQTKKRDIILQLPTTYWQIQRKVQF